MYIQAIKNKKLLRGTYSGKERIFQPYAFGVSGGKDEAMVVRAFQIGEGWKMFKTHMMSDLEEEGGVFEEIHPQYKKGDRAIKLILAEVSFCDHCMDTGSYAYDENHSKICEFCCKHDEGTWVPEGGKECCKKCGAEV